LLYFFIKVSVTSIEKALASCWRKDLVYKCPGQRGGKRRRSLLWAWVMVSNVQAVVVEVPNTCFHLIFFHRKEEGEGGRGMKM